MGRRTAGGHQAAMAATLVHRIFGPPGTGKTTTLTARIGEAARIYNGLVAVTSFTRTAALELRGRELPIAEDRVGTLHSFAYRALGAPNILETKGAALDEWNAVAPAGWKIGRKAGALDDLMGCESETGESFDDYCRLRQGRVPTDDRRWRFLDQPDVEFFEDWKREHDVLDFTDLIEVCLREELEAPIDAAVWFHDETQDSTPLELALLRHWARSCPGGLTLAGDDQQALYGFRGATPHAFLEGDATEEVLGQSYRLPEEIRAFAHDYGSRMEHREKEWRGLDKFGDVDFSNERIEFPETVLERIETELRDGAESVMVLVTCAYMLRKLLPALREDGIAYHNPFRPTRGDWNPLGRGMGPRLAAFLSEEQTWGEAWKWIELLDAKKCALENGTKATIKEAIGDKEFRHSPFRLWEWQSIAGEHLPAPGNARWLFENMLATHRTAMAYPLEVYEQGGLPALLEKPKVIVGTVHSVKGGEADSVLLFPDISKKAWAASHDDPDDLKRTFYVGMTRARRRLVLCERSSRYFESW